MSTTPIPAQPGYARQALIDSAGLTISRPDLVAAAGHVLAPQELITGDSYSTPDLALYRLIDMLGGDHETLAELADELLSAAIEETAANG